VCFQKTLGSLLQKRKKTFWVSFLNRRSEVSPIIISLSKKKKKSKSSLDDVRGRKPFGFPSKIPSPSQLRRPLLVFPRSLAGEISIEPDDASPDPPATMPAVGGGTAFDANHEPSLEEPSSGSGTAAAAAAANAGAASPATLKRRMTRSASHSNHDVKWPAQEDNVIKEALESWGKRVKEG
jgi:hypothetical protein